MPDITVEFKCEGCGGLLHKWTRQTVDSMPFNASELVEDYKRHPDRHPAYLVCRNCQKTVVYHDVIHVETYGDEVALSTKGPDGKAGLCRYFQVKWETMDAICAAWQKHRRG